MNTNIEAQDYIEVKIKDVKNKLINDLPKEPFVIMDEEIFQIAEFKVLGDNRIKISLPAFTRVNIEGFIDYDLYVGAILYMAEIEIIKEIIRNNSHDIDNSKIYFVNSEEMAYEVILEEENFNRVMQTYESIYYGESYMRQKYINDYFNKYNLFAFGDWHNFVQYQIPFDDTYCGLDYDEINEVDVQKYLDTPFHNWKDKPFILNSSFRFGNLSILVVEHLQGDTSRVFLDYRVRETDFQFLDGDKSKMDNNLLYNSFKLWSLIKVLEEFAEQDIFKPNSQVHFSGMDYLEFSVIVEAHNLNELILNITEMKKQIRTKQNELFNEYIANYKLDNMFK